MSTIKNILTIDVEDWFHILDIPSAPDKARWDSLPGRVEQNYLKLLDIVSDYNSSATCFFLGWAAKKYPHLVKETLQRGDETASHGNNHQLIYLQSQKDFFEDILESKRIIEDISGVSVKAYRSPGFSCTEKTPFIFETIREAGYTSDSSVFPAPRGHGGLQNGQLWPYTIPTRFGDLQEFPITITKILKKRICFSGGGYFRVFPYWFIKKRIQEINQQGKPVLVYIHPRDLDAGQPRLKMNWKTAF